MRWVFVIFAIDTLNANEMPSRLAEIKISYVHCSCVQILEVKNEVNLHTILELFLDCTEIHGGFDNFLVGRELLGVNRQEERPCLVLLF